MDWATAMNFIKEKDPGFAASAVGATLDDVVRLEEHHNGVSLPQLYVDFLLEMGEDDRFEIFGAWRAHRLSELMSCLPDATETSGRFIRVACESDQSMVTAYDVVLDRGRGDPCDPPLVLMEQGMGLAPEHMVDMGSTLAEWFVSSIFHAFEMNLVRRRRVIYAHGLSAKQARLALPPIVTMLMKLGYRPVLPVLPRIACLREESRSIAVEVQEDCRLLRVTVGTATGGLAGMIDPLIDDICSAAGLNPLSVSTE